MHVEGPEKKKKSHWGRYWRKLQLIPRIKRELKKHPGADYTKQMNEKGGGQKARKKLITSGF